MRQSVSVKPLFNARLHLAVQECRTCQITQQVIQHSSRRDAEKRGICPHLSERQALDGSKMSLLTEDYAEEHIHWSIYSAYVDSC